MLNDDDAFGGFDEDAGAGTHDEFFDDNVDPEILAAHEEAAAASEGKRHGIDSGSNGAARNYGETIEAGGAFAETFKKSGGWNGKADDSGIAMSPERSSISRKNATSPLPDKGNLTLQTNDSMDIKVERLDQARAAAPPVQSRPQSLHPQQQTRSANASKGRFAKPGAGVSTGFVSFLRFFGFAIGVSADFPFLFLFLLAIARLDLFNLER